MKNQSLSIRDWWSEDVRAWFTQGLSDDGFLYDGKPLGKLSPNENRRLRRLASDPRMEYVAGAIRKALTIRPLKPTKSLSPERASALQREIVKYYDSEEFENAIAEESIPRDVRFIECVWQASHQWKHRKEHTPLRVRERADLIQRECRKFDALLRRERSRIEYTLMVTAKGRPQTSIGKERFNALLETLIDIQVVATRAYEETLLMDYEVDLPVKLKQENAKVLFVLLYLNSRLNALFSPPLGNRAISISAAVALELDHEIDPDQLKNLLKYRKKKKGLITEK